MRCFFYCCKIPLSVKYVSRSRPSWQQFFCVEELPFHQQNLLTRRLSLVDYNYGAPYFECKLPWYITLDVAFTALFIRTDAVRLRSSSAQYDMGPYVLCRGYTSLSKTAGSPRLFVECHR